MRKKYNKICLLNLYAIIFVGSAFAQQSLKNPIVTGANFLSLIPDARGAGQGLSGAATTPTVGGGFWNPAKLAFLSDEYAFDIGYSPHLPSIAKGMGLMSFTGYKKLNETSNIALNIRYFSIGKVNFIDEQGYDVYNFNPSEYTAGLTYAKRLNEYQSIALTMRYIRSTPSLGIELQGELVQAANAIGADLGYYYSSESYSDLNESDNQDNSFRFGLALVNVGSKIGYLSTKEKLFQPMTIRLGGAYAILPGDGQHQFEFSLDLNKLLVPTPPERDSDGKIIKGKESNVSVPAAIFSSFTDAPGGFKEELQELGLGGGVSYSYQKKFFLRIGAYYEDPSKSGQQLYTVGLGLLLNQLKIDFGYRGTLGGASKSLQRQQIFNLTIGMGISSY